MDGQESKTKRQIDYTQPDRQSNQKRLILTASIHGPRDEVFQWVEECDGCNWPHMQLLPVNQQSALIHVVDLDSYT